MTTAAEGEGAAAPDIRIVAGDPDDAELAAVTAVLAAALDQLAAEDRRTDPGITPWQRSQRGLRRPLTPGTWSGFGA